MINKINLINLNHLKQKNCMTLDQLKILEKIIQKGSFKAAAEDLYKSQPAISIAISKLEKDLGFKIFNRDAYRATLTEKGQEYFTAAKELLENQRYLEKLARELKKGQEVYLSITVSALFPSSKLCQFLETFTVDYPSTRLEIFQESLKGTVEALIANEASLAIATMHDSSGIDTPLERKEILNFKMIPVISSSFPQDLNERQLKRINQIVLADTSRHLTKSSAGLLRGGKKWRVNSKELKKELIVNGLGWGSLPEHDIQEELAQGKVQELNAGSIKSLKFPIYLMRRSDIPHGPVATAIWERF